MPEIALVDVFTGLPDRRRKQGQRHSLQLCLALFTLAVAAGNQGFLAIGDWLKSYKQRLNITLVTAYLVERGFNNMAQAERKCKYDFAHRRCAYGDRILDIFRMK